MLERALFTDPGKRAVYRAMRHLGFTPALIAARLLPVGLDPLVVTRTVDRETRGRWVEPRRWPHDPERQTGTW